MTTRYAFATLLTSNDYLPGALTIAAALNNVHRPLPLDRAVGYETVCLVTPEIVDVNAIRLLRKAFNVVIGVEVIAPPDADSLTLLGRPDLDTALTKLHAFRLTQYAKVIFLDADVLPLRPLSHLFHLDHEFSAVPDVGWPDIFNSGVLVFSPGEDKFRELRELLNTKGTWDGADQGLLNEWRGNDWNRLSFTYNTTPTAIYTYAPAYRRFGPQISVIHFIGPHKPWHSIPYRAPGSSAQSTNMAEKSPPETPATPQRAYDYGSLVDLWYDVYDRHYRSRAAEPAFQLTKYTSAWNEGDPRHAIVAGGTLDLEELRHAALEGMAAAGISSPRVHGEGEYRTMPLEGRFDLIRPRTREERKQEQTRGQAQVRKHSTEAPASIPAPAEPSTTASEPSTPPEKILSLPSISPFRWTTLPTPGVHEIPPAPHVRLVSLPPTPLRYVPAPYKPLRNTREAGAQTVPIPSQQESEGTDRPLTPLMWNSTTETPPNVVTPAPMDTYFPRVDVWLSMSPSSDTLLTTMEPSPSKQRPDAAFGPSLMSATPEMPRRQVQHRNITREGDGSPCPDPAKVKRVFPWEERPRRAPGRVFPGEESPFTAIPRPTFATPERKAAFRSPMPSPLVGFPSLLQSHYPSDEPFRQRYASGVSSSSPLGLKNELDKLDSNSQDGDVEDEVDSEEETTMRSRARSSSIEMAKRTPKYRSIGVQTDPRDLCEEGIQVTTFVPVTEVAEKLILMNKRLGRNWVTSPGNTNPPAAAASHASTSPSVSPPTPTALASFESGDMSLSYAFPPPVSPPVSPPSAGDASPIHTRKGSRVWDPTRGVESFKRGSEEVLAKFMKKGSWEDCA